MFGDLSYTNTYGCITYLLYGPIQIKTLSKPEIKIIQLYHNQILKIINSNIMKKKSIHLFLIKERYNLINYPDEEDIRSILILLRPLLMSKEPIHVEKILKILIENSENDETKKYFEFLLTELQSNFMLKIESWKINGSEFNSKKVFDLMMNGEYFHVDNSKMEKLNKFDGLDSIKKDMFCTALEYYIDWVVCVDKILKNNGCI